MLPTRNRDLDMKQFILFTAALTALSATAKHGILSEINNNYEIEGFVVSCTPESSYLYGYSDLGYYILDKDLQPIISLPVEYIEQTKFNGSDEKHPFSQTFINNDLEFEYIISKTIKNEHDQVYYTGFKIMQTNGNCLADVDFEQQEFTSPAFKWWKINEKVYLSCYNLLFEVDNNASYKTLTLIKSTKAYPNPVKQGELFTIENLKNALGAKIIVSDMNGIPKLSFVCKENNKAVINTEKLTSGNYLYSIINNVNTIASGKLIIK